MSLSPWAGFASPASVVVPPVPESTWGWATVTDDSPLTIRRDGETDPLALVPDNLAGPLGVGDRVWVQFFGRRVIIHGRSGPELTTSRITVNQQAGTTSNVTITGTIFIEAYRDGDRRFTYNLVLTRSGSDLATLSDTTWYDLGVCFPSAGAPSSRVSDEARSFIGQIQETDTYNNAINVWMETDGSLQVKALDGLSTGWYIDGFIALAAVVYDPPPP